MDQKAKHHRAVLDKIAAGDPQPTEKEKKEGRESKNRLKLKAEKRELELSKPNVIRYWSEECKLKHSYCHGGLALCKHGGCFLAISNLSMH